MTLAGEHDDAHENSTRFSLLECTAPALALEALHALREGEESHSAIARRLKISRPTVIALYQRHREVILAERRALAALISRDLFPKITKAIDRKLDRILGDDEQLEKVRLKELTDGAATVIALAEKLDDRPVHRVKEKEVVSIADVKESLEQFLEVETERA